MGAARTWANRAFLINSAVLVAACLLLGGFFLGSLWHWDFFVRFLSVVLIAPALALAYGQYSAAFRNSRDAALVVAAVLGSLGSLFVLGALSTVVECVSSEIGMPPAEWLGLVVILLAPGLWLLGTCAWNLRRRRQLALEQPSGDPEDAIPTRRWGRWNAVAMLVGLLILGGGALFGIHDIPPRHAVHVTPGAAHLSLPPGAADVRVWRGSFDSLVYDFTIDEAGFREWVEDREGPFNSSANGAAIEPIVDEVRVYYCPEDAEGTTFPVRIERGWRYTWQSEDFVTLYVYDAQRARAYFQSL